MIFKKIPMQVYDNFHKMFIGENENTFDTCKNCKGACEYNKMGTLLPGEEEYMAKEMGLSVHEFEVRFLDVLKFADGTKLFLLKLESLCPFLNEETKECECRNFKPVFCKVYPVVFTIEAGEIKFTLDNWCELSKKNASRSYFEKSIPLLLSLPIPREWFLYVARYDNFCFDYNQLEKYRNGEIIKTFLLEEILSSEKANIETVRTCINFGEMPKNFDNVEII